jgi:tol-pal system protein YbgF
MMRYAFWFATACAALLTSCGTHQEYMRRTQELELRLLELKAATENLHVRFEEMENRLILLTDRVERQELDSGRRGHAAAQLPVIRFNRKEETRRPAYLGEPARADVRIDERRTREAPRRARPSERPSERPEDRPRPRSRWEGSTGTLGVWDPGSSEGGVTGAVKRADEVVGPTTLPPRRKKKPVVEEPAPAVAPPTPAGASGLPVVTLAPPVAKARPEAPAPAPATAPAPEALPRKAPPAPAMRSLAAALVPAAPSTPLGADPSAGIGAGPEAAPEKPLEKTPIRFSNNPMSLYKSGYKAVLAGENDSGRAHLTEFLRRHPRHELADNALYWLGESYYAELVNAQALGYFQRVIEEYPRGNKVPAAMVKAALTLQRLGEPDQGRFLLQQVLEVFPTSDSARVAQQKLADWKELGGSR